MAVLILIGVVPHWDRHLLRCILFARLAAIPVVLGVRIVDRHANLELRQRVIADREHVGKQNRMADLPFIAFFRRAFEDAPFDDAQFKYIETDP